MSQLPFDIVGDSTVITFPFRLGDEMMCVVEDDHVASLIPFEVKGFAYKDGKMYAIDEEGALNEYMTPSCIPKSKI